MLEAVAKDLVIEGIVSSSIGIVSSFICIYMSSGSNSDLSSGFFFYLI
jgi:hypothetical protein